MGRTGVTKSCSGRRALSRGRWKSEESSDVEEQNSGEAGEKEIRGTGIGIEEDFGAHVDGKGGVRVGEDAAQGFVEADGGGDVDGLAGDGRIGAVGKNQDLGAHLVKELVGIIDGDFDADAALAGDDGVIQILVVLDVADQMKGVGILKAVEKFAALAPAIGIVDDGVDLADVGVDAIAEEKHLQNRDDQGEVRWRSRGGHAGLLCRTRR